MGGAAEVADLAMADMDLGEALPRASLSVMQQHRRTPAVVAFEDRYAVGVHEVFFTC